jgi:hypothetical protein
MLYKGPVPSEFGGRLSSVPDINMKEVNDKELGVSGLTFLSASPSNPISNISDNGLGYFSAYSVNKGFEIIPY